VSICSNVLSRLGAIRKRFYAFQDSLVSKVTSLQLKIAELEEEKRRYIMTAEKIKAQRDKMERDYLERLCELEINFTETKTDYDSRLKES